MTKKELLELIKDAKDTDEIRFRHAYRNDSLEIRSVQVVRGAILVSDEKELLTYGEALEYARTHKCPGGIGCNCYQCMFITFKKGETCSDVYVEKNFDKIERNNETLYKLHRSENNHY